MAFNHLTNGAWTLPEFKNFLTGRICYVMGIRMTNTIIPWWMYELTGDPLSLGLIGLAEVIPAISLALYAGQVIDTSEKRSLMVKAIAFNTLIVVILMILAWAWNNEKISSHNSTFLIYTCIACTGLIRAFSGPTSSTLVGLIVPRPLLPNAVTLNSGSWLLSSVLGHALGGFLIALLGLAGALCSTAILMSLGMFSMSRLQLHQPLAGSVLNKSWQNIQEGLSFVKNTKEIFGTIILDLFAVLFGGVVALIPVFAKDILQVGPMGFGWLNAATDIGSMLTILWLSLFPLIHHQGRWLIAAITGFGLCILLFGLSTWFWLSFVALFFSGMFDGVSVVIRSTILQLKTPDHLRGRVMSVNSIFINSSNELGQFESGVAGKLLGPVRAVIFGGIVTLGVAAYAWWKMPDVKKIQY